MKIRYLLGTAVVVVIVVGLRVVERTWDAFLIDADYDEVYVDEDEDPEESNPEPSEDDWQYLVSP